MYHFAEPPKNPPAMWPFVLGTAAVIGVLSAISLRGQREIHERIEREHAAEARRQQWERLKR